MTQVCKLGANRDQTGYEIGRAPQRPWRARGSLAPAFLLVGLMIVATTAIAARAAIVSIAPATAAVFAGVGMPVNLRGLTIADVHATVTHETEGQGELVVTGEIANLRDRDTPVPSLRLALRGQDGRELYAWIAREPTTRLGARERVAFRARLAAPPAGVREVLVKFAEPGNKGAFTESPS
jgi:hypothetical protein